MESKGAPPRGGDRWEAVERLLKVVALLIMAIAALVAALHGAGPT